MLFHVLLNPLVPSNKEYTADAFNQLAIRWSELFASKGHTVYFYSTSLKIYFGEPKINIISVLTEEDYVEVETIIGSCNNGTYLCSTTRSPELKKIIDGLITKYQNKADEIISRIKTPGDFVIHFYGCTMEDIKQNHHDLFHVDPCVLSYCYLPEFVCFSCKTLQGYLDSETDQVAPVMSTIIPPFFDPYEFDFTPIKKDFFLYMARIQKSKGADVIFNLAKVFNHHTYVMAGYLKPECDTKEYWILEDGETYKKSDYPNIKMVGFKTGREKMELLSECRALIQPSPYHEPFGFNVIEAYLSGTPVITSTLGSFNEIVIEGVTGFRCFTWEEYEFAQENVQTLNNFRILEEGYKYTSDIVYPLYMIFFEAIKNGDWKS